MSPLIRAGNAWFNPRYITDIFIRANGSTVAADVYVDRGRSKGSGLFVFGFGTADWKQKTTRYTYHFDDEAAAHAWAERFGA